MGLSDKIKDKFNNSLKIRNRLFHNFYRQHDFKIDNDNGRDFMIQDLEEIHEYLFSSWQLVSHLYDGMRELTVNIFTGNIEPISEGE